MKDLFEALSLPFWVLAGIREKKNSRDTVQINTGAQSSLFCIYVLVQEAHKSASQLNKIYNYCLKKNTVSSSTVWLQWSEGKPG